MRMVEGIYEKKKGRVVCGRGILEEFRVGVGLGEESALNPLLFFAVVEVISNKARTMDILRKLIYVNNLAVVADSAADLQKLLVDWKEIFGKNGLRVSLDVGQAEKKILTYDWMGRN